MNNNNLDPNNLGLTTSASNNQNYNSTQHNNQNSEQQAYNRNKLVNTEEFNRTIDAYYNPNEKAFFNLEDYGYILNTVNEEEQKRIQTEMNELYKRKKNNYYDA